MKNFILFLSLLLSITLLAQTPKDSDSEKVALGFGWSFGLESIDQVIAEDLGISSIGGTWIDLRVRLNILTYINLDVGWSISNFKDELPFTEAVIFTSGQLSGLPSTGKSKISSSGLYYSIGGRAPITKNLKFNAGIGQRKFSARRSIPQCTNCNEVDLDIDAGNYIRTGLSWLSFEATGSNIAAGEIDLLYTYYFEETFQYTVTLGIFVYL